MKKYIDITPNKFKTNIPTLLNTPLKSNTPSKEPNDASLIAHDPKDSLNTSETVRYGEETDLHDI